MVAQRRGGKRSDKLEGSLFLLQSAMLDRSRSGVDRASLHASNAVAAGYWQSGRLDEALALWESVAGDCRAVLGAMHPDTLVVEGNIAVTCVCLKRWEQGLTLLADNVGARQRVLGDDHPVTILAQHALATAYQIAGRRPEAREQFTNVAAQRARVLGPAHPETLVSRLGLAFAHADCGDAASAVSVLAAALQDAELSAGPLDEMTVIIRGYLAQGHAALGRMDLALSELTQAVADGETVLGAEHPDAVALRADLAELTSSSTEGDRLTEPFVGDPTPDGSARGGGRTGLDSTGRGGDDVRRTQARGTGPRTAGRYRPGRGDATY